MTEAFHRLQQWAVLEPERCRELEEMIDVKLGGPWVSVCSFRISSDPSPIGWACIQAAVQEAIYRRGWRFQITDISRTLNYANRYHVDVMNDNFDRLMVGEYESPAIGLLDAYVQSLQKAEEEPTP